MGTHCHIWRYVRDEDGTIPSMERDDQIFPKQRQANDALTGGRQYRKADQVLLCLEGSSTNPYLKR